LNIELLNIESTTIELRDIFQSEKSSKTNI
jgi:hypothetical protein